MKNNDLILAKMYMNSVLALELSKLSYMTQRAGKMPEFIIKKSTDKTINAFREKYIKEWESNELFSKEILEELKNN